MTTAGLDSNAAAIDEACAHFQEHGSAAELPTETSKRAFARLSSGVSERRAAAGHPPLADLTTDVLPRFLAVLTLQCAAPRRELIPTLAPFTYAKPIAIALGHPNLAAEIWEAVLSLVRTRMRSGPCPARPASYARFRRPRRARAAHHHSGGRARRDRHRHQHSGRVRAPTAAGHNE